MDDNSAGEYHTLRVPPGTVLDGAVVELQAPADRTIITAEIRIPGPAAHAHYFTMVTGGMACACGERIP